MQLVATSSQPGLIASMGPRLFSRGNAIGSEDIGRRSAGLQWGRGFSAAEIIRCTPSSSLPRWLQWGRGFSAAEIAEIDAETVRKKGASMGPRLFSRGNRPSGTLHCAASTPSFNGAAAFQPRKSGRRASALCHAPIASMGPRLFSRGNAAQADYAHVADGASMGPRLFSRGNAAISRGRRRDRDRSFNGAAAFQPRKFVRVPER